MKVLGISAYYHDSAAALTIDGSIVAAVQEERFSRKKHDADFPANAVRYCLEQAELSLDELDAIAFYDKPFLKFERLIETYYTYAPRGIFSFLKAMPVWMKEKLFLRSIIKKELKKLMPFDKKKLTLLFPEHHLSHAASAYYPSPFEEAAILTIDGVGEWATASICLGKGGEIQVLKELHFPDSVGLLYSAFTYYLGFKVNSGEYKLMGLAPYGCHGSARVEAYKQAIREKMVQVQADGSIRLAQHYFDYQVGLRMARERMWEPLFGFKRRKEEEALTQQHCDLALAIQEVTEDIVLKMAAEAKRASGSKNLCMAGGVALNCVANGKLLREKIFEEIWIQPAAGDAGGALGAALASEYIYCASERKLASGTDSMQAALLGPECGEVELRDLERNFGAVCHKYSDDDTLCAAVAGLIAKGLVAGWCQGRAEFGPRALGNRSILADPRDPAMQQKLNLKIKQREGFRPFAPAVAEEATAACFDLDRPSPYMLFVAGLKCGTIDLPGNYQQLPLMERLRIQRSALPAVTHVDMSARVQTVSSKDNPLFHKLLKNFEALTGYAVLINTSFNVRGEPPVLNPLDAYRCFMNTDMDVLVINRSVFLKNEQAAWEKAVKKKSIILD